MKSVVKWAVLAAIVVFVLGGFSAKAASFGIGDWVTVTENSVSPRMIVTITVPAGTPDAQISGSYNVYAGVNNLTITRPSDGAVIQAQGFCIDPFHWSANGPASGYNVVSLSDSPKPPGDITSGEAIQIGMLWAAHFNSAQSDALDAAALQVAIWTLVGNDVPYFSITALDTRIIDRASTWLNEVATPNAAASADLLGLTGSGQDYVVQRVPDGGATVILLGMGMLGLAVAGRQLRFC